MRLYAPLYEGDGILRPDAAIGASARALFKAPAPAMDLVRSNIQVEAANETALGIPVHATVEAARDLRSAELARLLHGAYTAVAGGLKAACTAVADWFERGKYQERDDFFAASANLADLEQRQRHFERTGLTRYY